MVPSKTGTGVGILSHEWHPLFPSGYHIHITYEEALCQILPAEIDLLNLETLIVWDSVR